MCILQVQKKHTIDGEKILRKEILSIFMIADRSGSGPKSIKEKFKKIPREQALTFYSSGRINQNG